MIFFINKCFEDIVFSVKCFYFSNKISIIDKYLYYYRKHKSSFTNFMSLSKLYEYIHSLQLTKAFLIDKNIYSRYIYDYLFLTLRFFISSFYRVPCIYIHTKPNINIFRCFFNIFSYIIKLCSNNSISSEKYT